MSARLSYIVVTDTWETILNLVDCLEAQTEAAQIELVAIASGTCAGREAPELAGVQVVHRKDGGPEARADAVRAATGDIVVLGETHVLLDPGWARAVLDACDAGADVVLPLMENANPTPLTWAAFAMDYGRYSQKVVGRVPVPAYNAAFRRDVLLSLDSLETILDPGLALDAALRARGARIMQVTDGRTRHLNISLPTHWVHERILGGCLVASRRARGWSLLRRAGYALGAPAIAVVLFSRNAAICRRGGGSSALALLALACPLCAAGEAAGYAGLVRSRHRVAMLEYEMHKRAYLTAAT